VKSFSQDDKGCEVLFTYNINDNNLSNFYHKVISGGDRIVSYHWDFGDGYVSNESNPEHVYLNNGTYVTCLTVQFDNNCIATYCDTIKVENSSFDPMINYSISGNVYAGNCLLPEGVVVLFRKINEKYKAIAYTNVHNGLYSFNNLVQGNYWLYAIPYFNVNTVYYPNYFPTYYGDKISWQQASSIFVNGIHTNKNIYLLNSLDFFIGNDSVYGNIIISDSSSFEYNVYLNNWFSEELPPQDNLQYAPNQVVLLADENNKVQRFALTSHMGYFVFKSIPRKIIKLKVEKFGVNSPIYSLNPESENNVLFILNTDSVFIKVDKNNYQNSLLVNVFPNPVTSNIAFIEINTDNFNDKIEIVLSDLNGQLIYNQKFSNFGKELYLMPLQNLSNGIYLVSVKSKDNVIYKKIIISR
jgi:PKD repeat protein